MFAEGASLDWSAVYLRDQMGSSAGLAAATTTGFMLTMAVARLVGDTVVNRLGAVRTVRAGGVLAALGGVLIVVADSPAPAMGGFALLGLGIAVVVPSASRRPDTAAPTRARRSRVSRPSRTPRGSSRRV